MATASTASLKVSENRRYLEYPDGRPFFYLADTAWELFHRLNREEAETYLQDRANKGYTAIQAVVLAEFDGLREPNAYGHCPLKDNDPTKPEEGYFQHVDWIVRRANELGMFIAMLPTWGDKWTDHQGGDGPVVFNPDNARAYGEWLGRRYRDANIIWVLGGDRTIKTPEHAQIIRGMAAGLEKGDGGRHLMTFHPRGQHHSSTWFHEDQWLDFNMCQTGHSRDRDNYNSIAADYARLPLKPCIDGEPGYENLPSGFNVEFGRLLAHDVRKSIWWSLFSGACGHTYGCNDVWQFYAPPRASKIWAQLPWQEAIHLPGAGQMVHARNLIEQGGYFDRLPDQAMINSLNPAGAAHIRACRGPRGDYALIYAALGHPFSVRTHLLDAATITAQWLDPRNGSMSEPQEHKAGGNITFTPASAHTDWVLILRPA